MFPEIKQLKIIEEKLKTGWKKHFNLGNLYGSSKSICIFKLYQSLKKKFIVTGSDEALQKIHSDLASFHQGQESIYYLSPDSYLHPVLLDLKKDKLSVKDILILKNICELNDKFVLLIPERIIQFNVPVLKQIEVKELEIKVGERINYNLLLDELNKAGFRRNFYVEFPGEYAVRGQILDVFDHLNRLPLRIVLNDDIVESVRYFDIESQETIQEIKMVKLLLSNNTQLSESFLCEEEACDTIYNQLPKDSIFVYVEPDEEKVINEYAKVFQNVIFLSSMPVVATTTVAADDALQSEIIHCNFDITSIERFKNIGMSKVIDELRFALQEGKKFYIICTDSSEAKRIKVIISNIFKNDFYTLKNSLKFIIGNLSEGFGVKNNIYISASELLGKVNLSPLEKYQSEIKPIDNFFGLEVGDYVVHIDYGVGKFLGLEQTKINDRLVETAVIEYKDEAKVYVPVTDIGLIYKYLSFGNTPALDDIHSNLWLRKKRLAQKHLFEFGKELLEIQARRETLPGIPFPKDNEWSEELELSFPYADTDDQMRLWREIKSKMESPKPMDFLICGDVGFGKTELALRASFKATLGGKQVALLCPTTVLAEQHYYTFKERLSNFPVNVEMLSRFKTKKEQKKIIAELARGAIDIIIGTHRLLQKDVLIPNLGLLIIDEEQRFGVKDKERIKRMRSTNIDILTLTATPIPRTLHQALIGIKDISVLSTPPPGRKPIITKLIRFNPEVIKQAIEFELSRQGQVFFVHNVVSELFYYENLVRKLVPSARVLVAHGQLPEKQLEERMLDFYRRKFDVLVTTTIIASGIDLPNVNTIIINNAHNYGLCDLHQLRGRVGRSSVQAFCFLCIPDITQRVELLDGYPERSKKQTITPDVLKRLRLIEEYSYLGAGFKIAQRDMEIRGVGNILGKEQHGHIVNIGYELYARLLEKAIRELQNKKIDDDWEPAIVLNMNVMIPRDYIFDDAKRLYYYRRLFRAVSLEEIDKISEECRDIYGKPPVEFQNIIMLSRLKLFAKQLGICMVLEMEKDEATGESDIFCQFLPSRFDLSLLMMKSGKVKFNMSNDGNSFLLKINSPQPLNEILNIFQNWLKIKIAKN